jgi:putative transposase
MAFWTCYYHVVWATKYRQPVILPMYEPIIQTAIQEKSAELKSHLIELNMVSDHIHIAVSIPPSLAIAKWVGSVKGASARAVNTTLEPDNRFHWQESYGVMSFGEKALPQVREYSANPKMRHASGDLNSYLENVGEE